ncbi:MAG: IS30 family transposase, partial [Acidobacteria bacterium]|nr:IS30 family transposase [Acidobacteriota bacterium]
QIYALKKAGHNQTQLAAIIGCHQSTVSRELRRNRGGRGYRPKQADELARARQLEAHQPRIAPETWAVVESLLRQEWSPEQITGRLALEGQPSVSHERIYQHIYADKRRGGTLHLSLRCRKARRKRYGSYDRRGQLPHRTSIEERPQIVESKGRFGDWEADLIIGHAHRAAVLSMVERKSKLTLLHRVADKTAEAVTQASLALLVPHAARVHTVTSDNGREFAGHQQIATGLAAQFYFAHPYASWERGLNENTNGLVRQYFPKRHDFTTITEAEVASEKRTRRPL